MEDLRISDFLLGSLGLKGQDPLSPFIPERPLTWNGIPLFHVGAFPEDFPGRLYFVMGQGLGDHVNGFRVLHEVKKRFPIAHCILYADRRWEELVSRIPGIEVRWYPEAMDPRSKSGTNNPYDKVHREIVSEIQTFKGKAFLAYDHFPMPDRHARGETTLEAISRAIALDLGANPRPYLPLTQQDFQWADQYLDDHSLIINEFVVVAPYSWPNKMWPKEYFSELLRKLSNETGLKIVVVSYPELGFFDDLKALYEFELSLGQIAALIKKCRLFIGLDSGLSHMAAAIDISMVTIFMEKKTIPFEVRACSQYGLYIVESFFNEAKYPTITSVFEGILFLLADKESALDKIPVCPACQRKCQYISGVMDKILRFTCVCGFSRFFSENDMSSRQSLELSRSIIKRSTSDDLYLDQKDLSISCNEISRIAEMIIGHKFRKVVVLFGFRNISDGSPESKKSKISWSFDALIFWMNHLGYRIISSRLEKSDALVWSLTFSPKNSNEKSVITFPLSIPWGKSEIRVANWTEYINWYSFGIWGRSGDLIGIAKSMVSFGLNQDACRISRIAFNFSPTLKSFRWMMKTYMLDLFTRFLMKGQKCRVL